MAPARVATIGAPHLGPAVQAAAPVDPGEESVSIEGILVLEESIALDSAAATVSLLVAELEDAQARTVASVTLPELSTRIRDRRIEFELRARVSQDTTYALAAEVRREGSGPLRSGDLRTTERVNWRCGTVSPVVLRLYRIS